MKTNTSNSDLSKFGGSNTSPVLEDLKSAGRQVRRSMSSSFLYQIDTPAQPIFGDLIIVSNRLPVTLLEKVKAPKQKKEKKPVSSTLDVDKLHKRTNSLSRTTSTTNVDLESDSSSTGSDEDFSPNVENGKTKENNNSQTRKKSKIQKPKFKKSSGGLVTALTGMGRNFTWVGWLGEETKKQEERQVLKSELRSKYNCHPVFIPEDDADAYYNGFSNGILWTLFHYLFEKNSIFNKEQWEAYIRVNQAFCDAVLEVYKDGDMIWVHDYHLMLLPQMLRLAKPDANIAFFLHIPFPSSEIYRVLPVRSELLEGVLACNLIGFHTYNFARHFLSACTRTLGAEATPKGLYYKGMFVAVQVFPIGIDPDHFMKGVENAESQKRIKHYQEEKFKGKKILVGIDRLDYTKGIDLKLSAYEEFLKKYPDYANDTILIQVGVPTRQAVLEYKNLISEVNESVGRINSLFGTLDGFPVHYINKSVDFYDLCALYTIADAVIVTSIRDGMNLVSSEFVACQEAARALFGKEPGVLILSEFAGAARSLGGSIIINPWNIDHTADSIKEALDMEKQKKIARHAQNNAIVQKNTAKQWGSNFLTTFERSCAYTDTRKTYLSKSLPIMSVPLLKKTYKASKQKKLFLLDYDGTLVDIQKYPSLAIPSEELKQTLRDLSADKNNIVYVISGRDKRSLNEFFGDIEGIGLVPEHGFYCRHPHKEEWESLYSLKENDLLWMKEIIPILHHVESRTPGSHTERKESSIVFHFRNADPDFGAWQSNELKLHLETSFGNAPVDIVHGKKVLEIRHQSVSKGNAVKKILELVDNSIDFIFCAGDDRTDEDMYEMIQETYPPTSASVSPASPGFNQNPMSPKLPAYKVQRNSPIVFDDIPEQSLQQTINIVTCVVGAQKASKAKCIIQKPKDLYVALTELTK